MAVFTPSAGLNCILSKSASGTRDTPGTGWTLDMDPKVKDVSNFTTGRMKIGTLLDGTLSFDLIWDTTNQSVSGGSNPTGYYAGSYVTIYAFTDLSNTKFFVFAGIVQKITPKIASIEDALVFSVVVGLSSIPGSTTFTQLPQFVYPI